MSKQVLQMKYHPAKKEVSFARFVNGKAVPVRSDSKLYAYMNERGKFVLQDHGNAFFEDIADAFDGEKSVRIEVVTTKNDYEDLLQMIEYYNMNSGIEITAESLSYLPSMEDTYKVVRDHGENSITILKKHQKQFFDVPLDNPNVKACVEMFSAEVQKEVDSIREKIDSMSDNSINLCFAGVYSAGKSALINAIIGHKILPESDGSKTAYMAKIKSPKKGEPVRICFTIHHYWVELVWNDHAMCFVFATELNENTTKRKIQELINNHQEKKIQKHIQIYEILDVLNAHVGDAVIASERVGKDINIFYPIGLDSDDMQFTIYDTPGTDSDFGEHQMVLQDALSLQTHSILIFVATPTKMEGSGNNALISYLRKAEEKTSKTSIDIGRSLFVINHADDSTSEKLTEIGKTGIIRCKDDESFSIKLTDKKLFFTSAKYAYSAKAKMNNIATSEDEEILEDDYARICKPARGQYYKLNRIAASEKTTASLIERSENAFSDAKSSGNIAGVFYVASGLFALENEIKIYGEKYAAAVRAFAIIDSVDKALSTMNKNAMSLERQNEKSINQINSEIEEMRSSFKISIDNASRKHKYPENASLPTDVLKELQLNHEYLQMNVTGNTISFINKLLKGWFFGLGKVNFNDKHKKEINQRITSVLSDFTDAFLVKRQRMLEKIRDAFTKDVKKTIQDNGKLSDAAKDYVLKIRKPEIKNLDKLIEIGGIYDSNKRADKFLWINTPHIDKDGFAQDAEDEMKDIVEDMRKDFEKDFRTALTSALSAIESEFTQNIEKYSLLMQAKLEDKKVMEQLRVKISAAACDLISCQDELNKVIWSVKENV